MKNKLGLIFPVVMLLFGTYVLITALSPSGEQVTLLNNYEIPRGLAMMFGLICLGGGAVTTIFSLAKKNSSVME
jgi:uncharacterized membrane protein